MTYIAKAPHDQAERAKWRVNADNAAKHLKSMSWCENQTTYTAAFVFDDGTVKLPINVSLIQKLNEKALADWIFETVLDAQNSPAPARKGHTGSTADGAPEPHDAAGQAIPSTGGANDGSTPSGGATSAPVPCRRRLEPDFTQPCPNEATGGLRITLKPSPTVSKRWGLHSMLTFVMDLPVCASCFPKVNITEITDQALRARLGKSAQQMNNGVLVDWSQTVIEHVTFDDPQLAGLRATMAKREQVAANDPTPGPEAA